MFQICSHLLYRSLNKFTFPKRAGKSIQTGDKECNKWLIRICFCPKLCPVRTLLLVLGHVISVSLNNIQKSWFHFRHTQLKLNSLVLTTQTFFRDVFIHFNHYISDSLFSIYVLRMSDTNVCFNLCSSASMMKY